jgi:predicted acetyltransferase
MQEREHVDIRRIPEERIDESMELSAFAFQYELTEEDRRHREALLAEQEQWGAYVDGRLAAKLAILEFQCYIQGHALPMGGIAGVATWPEYRRGGLVKQLMLQALVAMKEKGQLLSFLYPFQFEFYRKFGWEMCAEQKQLELSASQLPKWPAGKGKIVRVDRHSELLPDLYAAYAASYNGMLRRSEAWWTHRVLQKKQGMAAVHYNEAGEPGGYVLYQVKDRVLKVHELIALNHEARLGLWRFLGDHDSMLDRLVWQAPAEESLPFLLDNPMAKQELVPTFMARIVDAPAFLDKFPFASGVEGSFCLRLEDAQAPWNQGVWHVTVDEAGKAVVREAEEELDRLHLPQASCSIQTLSTLLMGYRRPAFLQEIGRLQAEEQTVELLERLVPPRPVFIADFF